MEKRLTRSEEAALKAYPKEDGKIWNSAFGTFEFDKTAPGRIAYQQGYEQADKNIISHIREQIERWMPKDNGEEYIKGERTAFNSVLHLLKEMEDEQ